MKGVLEIPLNSDHIPIDIRASSRGRFLAIDSRGEIIDPEPGRMSIGRQLA
jgi:hypothetical protein